MKKITTIVSTALVGVTMYADTMEASNEYQVSIPSVREITQTIGQPEEKSVSKADGLEQMFTKGKASGQLKSIYAGYDFAPSDTTDTYATAVGGQLKYELAELNGFNAAAAFYTSHDVDALTGDGSKQNNELSSSQGSYTQLAEAYINYKYNGLNLRAGRQVIDTPLSDSDDIRMIPNTFEAYIASYELEDLTFMAGLLKNWQGFDADLDGGWQETGENGTYLASLSYETQPFAASAWYYDITKSLKAYYADGTYNYEISENYAFHVSAQVLLEREVDNSGYEADIYGASAEFEAYGAGFNIAYNKAVVPEGKQSFSGFGGGALFTSMDMMILDNIAADRDVDALVGGVSYRIYDFNIMYAYGDYSGGRDSLGQKAHVVEQNLVFEYNISDDLLFSAIYVKEDDKENKNDAQTNWDRYHMMITYNF